MLPRSSQSITGRPRREAPSNTARKERVYHDWMRKMLQRIQGGERQKQIRLDSMSRHLEKLKILADINDPLIKKRFEDGEGMLIFFLI